MRRVPFNRANHVGGRAVSKVVLVLAALSLILQLLPAAISPILSPLYRVLWPIFDVRGWSSLGWFAGKCRALRRVVRDAIWAGIGDQCGDVAPRYGTWTTGEVKGTKVWCAVHGKWHAAPTDER